MGPTAHFALSHRPSLGIWHDHCDGTLFAVLSPGNSSHEVLIGGQAGPDRSSMTDGSITHWIAQVKDGGESVAQQELWDRYFIRLAALASRKLHDLPPQFRYEEDLALSALDSFFMRVQQDDFSRLRDRTDLWRCWPRLPCERRSIGVARR